MKNIDDELITWAVNKIKTEYPEDVALLIGQVGACKIPTDEQKMSFDFFVPATERGNQMAETFVIEDMGYDLYPISWERLRGIADFKEPRMIFVLDKGEIIYAKSEQESEKFNALKERLHHNLKDKSLTFHTALEFLNTAMEILNTMLFEDSLCKVRKAAGAISCYLLNAIAMVNGTYLEEGYMSLLSEIPRMKEVPEQFTVIYQSVIAADAVEELQTLCYQLTKITRDFLAERKPSAEKTEREVYYNDLADWYQEARYSFRRIEYYAGIGAWEECFLLGCYLQIEFDSIYEEFSLKEMDLLGVFHKDRLNEFANRAKEIEGYIQETLTENHANVKIFKSLDEFLLR